MAKDDCCENSESQPEQWSCVRWNQNNELKDAKVLWSWEGLQSADPSLWFAVGDYKRPLSHYTFTFTLIPLFTNLNSHKTYAEQSPKCFFLNQISEYIYKKKTYSIQYRNKMWIKWNVTRLQAGTECFEQPCLNWSWRRWTEKCSWLLQQLIDPFIQWSFDYSHFMDAFLCKWKSKWCISFQVCFISLRARARTVTSFGV